MIDACFTAQYTFLLYHVHDLMPRPFELPTLYRVLFVLVLCPCKSGKKCSKAGCTNIAAIDYYLLSLM
jgi:hypothetical protein